MSSSTSVNSASYDNTKLDFSRRPKHREMNKVDIAGTTVLNNTPYGTVHSDLAKVDLDNARQEIEMLKKHNKELEESVAKLVAQLMPVKKNAKELTEAGVAGPTSTEIQEELALVKALTAECESFRGEVEKLSGEVRLTEASKLSTDVLKDKVAGHEAKLKEYAEKRAAIVPKISEAISKLNAIEVTVGKRTIDKYALKDAANDQVTAYTDRTPKPLKAIRTFSMVLGISPQEVQGKIKDYLKQYDEIFNARGELQGQLSRLTESFATMEKTMPLIRARIPAVAT